MEILIADGQSTDSTRAVIASIAGRDGHIRARAAGDSDRSDGSSTSELIQPGDSYRTLKSWGARTARSSGL
jgi:hypothetical protein